MITLSREWSKWPFEPRKWQREALPIVVDRLPYNPICRAVMGAGKSVMIAELCYQYDGKIIVTTPTRKLVEELSETIAKACRSVGRYYTKAKEMGARIIVCCNASLPVMADRMALRGININEYAWIADECHKTETETIKGVLDVWNPPWRVGFTATPCRSDESESISLFGEVAYNYGPWQAIRDGVIVPYIVHHPPHPRKDINEECVEWIHKQAGPGIIDAISIDDATSFSDMVVSSGRPSYVVHSNLPGDEIQSRLVSAERENAALVHVDLLSEGVNMPWLRWLGVRRPTGSAIRFAQYVGRGLRSYPGKRNCPVFDPHDLFGELSIDPEAVLAGGEGDEPEDSEDYALKLDFLNETAKARADSQGKKLDGPPKNIISPAASWVRRVSQEWKSMGVLPMRLDDGPLRRERVGLEQVQTIRRLVGVPHSANMPDLQRQALKIAWRVVESGAGGKNGADWGTASDLIQIMRHLKTTGQWPMGSEGAVIQEKQGVII